jgi:HEAT repeat protein
MIDFRQFLSRRWLPAFLGGAALLFGLAMAHPYPRQSLFGPKIRGKPWCYWESEVRWAATHLREDAKRGPVDKKIRAWLGLHDEPNWPGGSLCGHKEMLPVLLKLAKDNDDDVKATATWAIVSREELHQEAALPFLREQLHEGNAQARIYAAKGIWRIAKDKDVLPTIRQAVKPPPKDWFPPFGPFGLRSEAVSVLAEIANEVPELIPEVLRFANDDDAGVRATTMRTIAPFGKCAISALIKGLGDSDDYVRGRAIDSLLTMGPEASDAIPSLERLLNHTNREIRWKTVNALIAIDLKRRQHFELTRALWWDN